MAENFLGILNCSLQLHPRNTIPFFRRDIALFKISKNISLKIVRSALVGAWEVVKWTNLFLIMYNLSMKSSFMSKKREQAKHIH